MRGTSVSLASLEAQLDLRDLLLMLIRWFHSMAAVLFVGASVLCLIVGREQQAGPTGRVPAGLQRAFGEMVSLSLIVFLASGALLTFERLSGGVSTTYVLILALKVLLSLALYRWAFTLRRDGDWRSRSALLLVSAGALVLFLAGALKTIFELNLRP